MPELFSARASWRIHADELREQLQQVPRNEETIGCLSNWFDILRKPPYDARNGDERLVAALSSEEDNPVAWSARVPFRLPLELEAQLSGSADPEARVGSLDPLIRYVLGRACMKSIMAHPSDSAGLSLAYFLLWPLGQDGIGYAGADDELLEQLGTAPDARAEIWAEAGRLRENPIKATRRFDRDRATPAIQNASNPVSLEACTHWQIRELRNDTEFWRVIQVIGSSDMEFAASLLEMIDNPALVASTLRGSRILSFATKASLLRYVGAIFEDSGHWTGKTTAWMILLDMDDMLSQQLRDQIREVRSGGQRPLDPETIVAQKVDVVVEALLARSDGPRLALEWLAHVLWSVLLSRPQSPGGGHDDLSELEAGPVLLKALGTRFGHLDWANPLRVWALFGGAPTVAHVDQTEGALQGLGLPLPSWRDWLGQGNTLVPIAVAVHLWDDKISAPDWLAAWARLLCRNLEGHPAIHQLADSNPSHAARYLAWPLVHSGCPSERFSELWSDAGWQLTRARFSGFEKAADIVRPCVSLIRIGLYMLEWSALVSASDTELFASILADAIDEVRYTLPELGVAHWSAMAGSLAGVMAGLGLLKDDGARRLLARYHGDDEALAAAAVNAAANGFPNLEIRRALASIGVNAMELTERWEMWNERLARDASGQPGTFLAHLLTLAQAENERE